MLSLSASCNDSQRIMGQSLSDRHGHLPECLYVSFLTSRNLGWETYHFAGSKQH